MKIKRCPLVFNNVLCAHFRCKMNEWYQSAIELRNAVIKNGLYGTGPIIYQISPIENVSDEADFQFYLPVNEPVDMPENEMYTFHPLWQFEDGLVLRHADLDDELEDSYELLKLGAESFQLELQQPFFNIYLDVFGGGIIDIYAPIIKEGAHGEFL